MYVDAVRENCKQLTLNTGLQDQVDVQVKECQTQLENTGARSPEEGVQEFLRDPRRKSLGSASLYELILAADPQKQVHNNLPYLAGSEGYNRHPPNSSPAGMARKGGGFSSSPAVMRGGLADSCLQFKLEGDGPLQKRQHGFLSQQGAWNWLLKLHLCCATHQQLCHAHGLFQGSLLPFVAHRPVFAAGEPR